MRLSLHRGLLHVKRVNNMKKNIISIILASIVAMGLTGCVNVNISEDGINITGDATAPVQEDTPEENGVGLANPWEEITPADLAEYHAISFVIPEGAEAHGYRWNESLKMAEVDFTLDGLDYNYRMAYSKLFQDISGLNYDWTVEDTLKVHECEGRTMKYIGEDESVEACSWYDEVWSRTNCLSVMSNDLDGYDILAVVDQVYYQSTPEDCMMEYLNSPYWVTCYDARNMISYESDEGEAVFVYCSPLYEAAGSNVVSISVHEDTTYGEVLGELKAKNNDSDAETVLEYFGAEGYEAYRYYPKSSESSDESGLEVRSAYIAIPCGKDVILLDCFMTIEPDEEMGMMVNSAFETLLDNFIVFEPADEEAVKSADNPDDALALLIEGNQKYLAGERIAALTNEFREDLAANGQHPYAVIVTCSDSTVPAEQIFNCSAGEIFVIKTAGNVVGDFELASVAYGVEKLGAPLVVVLGHTKCDAIAAACLEENEKGNISAIVKEIAPSIEEVKELSADEDEMITYAAAFNVINSMDRIVSSDIISEMGVEGTVKVVGAIYDIETGKIDWE